MTRLNRVPEAGTNAHSDAAQVGDLMSNNVITVTRHQTIASAHSALAKHGIHAVPVVDKKGEPVGVITSTDLIDGPSELTLIGQVMTKTVYTIPQYSDPQIAARMMRNHRIHHLVVTHEKKIVGILSSFDLLKLIEDRRFTMKSKASRPKTGGGKRRREEDQPGD